MRRVGVHAREAGRRGAGVLTTDHPTSSYGLPVYVRDDGTALGAAEVGPLVVAWEDAGAAEVAGGRAAGYAIEERPPKRVYGRAKIPAEPRYACMDCGRPVVVANARCYWCSVNYYNARRPKHPGSIGGGPSPLRARWAGRLPDRRPESVPEREWHALVAFVGGASLADVAADLGCSSPTARDVLARAGRMVEEAR